MAAAGFVIVDVDRCSNTGKVLDIRYLVLETHEGKFDIPKGQLDKGETFLETAYRELKEESLIKKSDIIMTWGMIHNEISENLKIYIAEIKKNKIKNIGIGTNPVTLEEEHKDFHWKNVHLAEDNVLYYMKGIFDWANTIIQ